MPEWETFFSWGNIAGFCTAGITKAHRQDSDRLRIVEFVLAETQPFAQAFATGIIPGNSAGVSLGSGRLADDHNAGFRTSLHDRFGAEGKVSFAGPAVAYRFEQVFHGCPLSGLN